MRSGKIIAACALIAIAMTACGSSSKSSSSSQTGTNTTIASSGNGGGSGGGSFCEKAKAEASSFASTGLTGKNADQLKSEYANIDAKLKQLQADAPSALKDDFATYATFAKKIQKVLGDANYDYTKVSPTAFLGLYTPQLSSALKNISAYFQNQCGITTPTT